MIPVLSTCAACQQAGAGYSMLCADCLQLLGWMSRLDDPHLKVFSKYWQGFRCLGAYQGFLADLIHRSKFQADLPLLSQLARLFASRLPDRMILNNGVVIPVPMKRSRRLKRGFNQAELLARTIAKVQGLAIDCRVVRHTGSGRVQHLLSREERLKNMRSAFQCTGPAPTIAYVVDDVYTTGATARAICSLLKANGCQYIELWIIAKTV